MSLAGDLSRRDRLVAPVVSCRGDPFTLQPWLALQVEELGGTLDMSEMTVILKKNNVAFTKGILTFVRIKELCVYNELVVLASLKILVLGLRNCGQHHSIVTEPSHRPIIYHANGQAYYAPTLNTLKLSMDSGPDRESTLERLEAFGINGVDRRIGTEELDCMVKS